MCFTKPGCGINSATHRVRMTGTFGTMVLMTKFPENGVIDNYESIRVQAGSNAFATSIVAKSPYRSNKN